MKIIAHAITTSNQAEKALEEGCDFLEVDVAKRFVFTKFTIQHHGIKGKLGIGPKIDSFLTATFKNKLFLDIKHAKYSLTYASKLSKLLKKVGLKGIFICGTDWKQLSQMSANKTCSPFYTLKEKSDFKKFTSTRCLAPPAGFSIKNTLINQNLLNQLRKNFPKAQIWVWTPNAKENFAKLKKLKVDGIITDNWKEIAKFKS